jgi:hypothetical protein
MCYYSRPVTGLLKNNKLTGIDKRYDETMPQQKNIGEHEYYISIYIINKRCTKILVNINK